MPQPWRCTRRPPLAGVRRSLETADGVPDHRSSRLKALRRAIHGPASRCVVNSPRASAATSMPTPSTMRRTMNSLHRIAVLRYLSRGDDARGHADKCHQDHRDPHVAARGTASCGETRSPDLADSLLISPSVSSCCPAPPSRLARHSTPSLLVSPSRSDAGSMLPKKWGQAPFPTRGARWISRTVVHCGTLSQLSSTLEPRPTSDSPCVADPMPSSSEGCPRVLSVS